MRLRLRTSCHIAAALVALPLQRMAAQRPIFIAPNAPADQSAGVAQECQWNAVVRALEPYVTKARATYPAAKQRFVAGLPHGQTLFVTVRLTDSLNHHEQVFLAVDSIGGDRILGRIASRIALVRGYRAGETYSTTETEIVDWLISQPDGTEDGNIVGKFLDTYIPPRDCPAGRDRTI